MRVLVAEDDPVIADFVSRGLREAGYAVDVASTGTDALKKALDGGYDAAVMDVMLPELDGLSVIEQLRAKRQQMPVLILSARHTVDDRVKGLQAGGDDYLTKPFAFAELLARLQALIAARRRRHRADATGRRRSHARSAVTKSRTGRQGHRAQAARVRAARIPDAASGTRPLEDDDPVARVGLFLRSGHQRRRRARLPPARSR